MNKKNDPLEKTQKAWNRLVISAAKLRNAEIDTTQGKKTDAQKARDNYNKSLSDFRSTCRIRGESIRDDITPEKILEVIRH